MEIIIAIAIIAFLLIKEKVQEHKANEYADKVVKRYDGDGTPKI